MKTHQTPLRSYAKQAPARYRSREKTRRHCHGISIPPVLYIRYARTREKENTKCHDNLVRFLHIVAAFRQSEPPQDASEFLCQVCFLRQKHRNTMLRPFDPLTHQVPNHNSRHMEARKFAQKSLKFTFFLSDNRVNLNTYKRTQKHRITLIVND